MTSFIHIYTDKNQKTIGRQHNNHLQLHYREVNGILLPKTNFA